MVIIVVLYLEVDTLLGRKLFRLQVRWSTVRLGVDHNALRHSFCSYDRVGITGRHEGSELDGQVIWRDNESRRDNTGQTGNKYGAIESHSRFDQDPALLPLVNETTRILDLDQRTEAAEKLYLRLRD